MSRLRLLRQRLTQPLTCRLVCRLPACVRPGLRLSCLLRHGGLPPS